MCFIIDSHIYIWVKFVVSLKLTCLSRTYTEMWILLAEKLKTQKFTLKDHLIFFYFNLDWTQYIYEDPVQSGPITIAIILFVYLFLA